ncbi:MAG: hypothetical protein WCY19_00290 [Candidatus Gastranaerophilaceae bacterium]
MKIPNIKTIKIANVLTQTLGAATLGLIAYDSHIAGKIKASAYEKNHKATGLTERYLDDMKLDSPSTVEAGVKKELFKYSLDENLTGFFTNIAGYGKGFASMLVSEVIPFGLAIGTFFGKRGGKQIFSKFCGAGLIAYGGIFLLQEAFGIGKSK